MTLYQILENVQFSDLVEPLYEIDPNTKGNLYSFKGAFDLLKMLQPAQSDGINIDVSFYDYEDGNPPQLSAFFHVRTDWNIMLSRDVIVDENCYISQARLAAILLWEITFYGFSDDEEYENLTPKNHILGNPFVERYTKLKQRHHDLNCFNPLDIGTDYYTFIPLDLSRKYKLNGPKRHREARQKKTIQKLRTQMNRWDLCERLIIKSQSGGEFADKIRREIMTGNTFYYYFMQSRTTHGNEINYLVDLIRDYFPPKEGSKALVFITGPQRIMDDNNLVMVWDALCSFGKIPSPRKHICGINNDLENLCLDILVFESSVSGEII